MSSRWFRLYDELVDDPKVQRLPAETFRGLINLWCLACRNDGALPPIEDVVFSLRVPVARVKKLFADLRNADLLDEDDGLMRPHNWNGRQFKSDATDPTAADRMRRHRNKDRNAVTPSVTPNTVTSPVTVTLPDTEQNRAEAETEQTVSLRSTDAREVEKSIAVIDDGLDIPPALIRPNEADYRREFEREFWPRYPHKVGKPAAFKAFIRARKTHDHDVILFGLDRYANEKPADRAWLNPATFLNQERFNDQPASPQGGSSNGHSRDPKAPLLRALADIAAEGLGEPERSAGADAGLRDDAGAPEGDRARALDLGPTDFRRAG